MNTRKAFLVVALSKEQQKYFKHNYGLVGFLFNSKEELDLWKKHHSFNSRSVAITEVTVENENGFIWSYFYNDFIEEKQYIELFKLLHKFRIDEKIKIDTVTKNRIKKLINLN